MAKQTSAVVRSDGRAVDELRPVKIQKNVVGNATGSVLIRMGNTHVLCGVSVENDVPRWMKQQKVAGGWLTAEYSMLPYAGGERSRRESSTGRVSGRTQEIQRLIGRSLRAVVDLETLGRRTVWVDCDVIQADGGTRTASITGAYVALQLAMKKLMRDGQLEENPIQQPVAAISVGVVDGHPMLDLCYEEDVKADVDMNAVMTGKGEFIEIQGTAEGAPFTKTAFNTLLKLASNGIQELVEIQAGT